MSQYRTVVDRTPKLEELLGDVAPERVAVMFGVDHAIGIFYDLHQVGENDACDWDDESCLLEVSQLFDSKPAMTILQELVALGVDVSPSKTLSTMSSGHSGQPENVVGGRGDFTAASNEIAQWRWGDIQERVQSEGAYTVTGIRDWNQARRMALASQAHRYGLQTNFTADECELTLKAT